MVTHYHLASKKFYEQLTLWPFLKTPPIMTNSGPLASLGIPSAIRRITAIAVLHIYKSCFAEHLLPFNYAFGIGGGLDFITTTLRLGVERYITTPESKNEFPTRCLISLDISNMFNAISRQKMQAIIVQNFPELEKFALTY